MSATNLKELLQTYKIEIPLLQRDYAQGRKSQEKTAKDFLDAIFKVLTSSKNKTLHIDFIYGYKEGDKFILIDGQQRITTLWLLYFYLHKRVNRLDEVRELLENFSYSVRESSKKFCKNLLKKDFSIQNKPSEGIIDAGGEFGIKEDLEADPTIKAMLNMLDLIDKKLTNRSVEHINRYIANFSNITFNVFNMDSFGLGEELYIKMNARGRQLSDYENLKAFMEKGIGIQKYNKLLVDIDTKWSDYFFDAKCAEYFDKRGKNFLHYANVFFKLQNNREVNLEENQGEDANVEHSVNNYYELLQNIDNLQWLDRVIDLLVLFDIDFKVSVDLALKNSSFFDGALSAKSICYFFSILWYMRDKEIEAIDKYALNDYLRVTKHFIENHRLDHITEHVSSFFKLFQHLCSEKDSIYKFLNDNSLYHFHSNIYTLEARKARLILRSRNGGENWEDILNKTSDNSYLVGWVDFLLDFSDDNFEFNNYNKSNKKKYNNPNLEKFTKYASLTLQIIEFCNKDKENLSLFHRAFLSIGDYGFYSTNHFYGNYFTSLIFRDREAYIWIFNGSRNIEQRPLFKELLDRLLYSSKDNLRDKLEEIISKTNLATKWWWEQLLICQKELFEFLNNKSEEFQDYPRIRYLNDSKCLKIITSKVNKVELLPKLRSHKNVRDVLDYGFYSYCKQKDSHKIELSEYIVSESQYGNWYEERYGLKLKSHFMLNGKEVLCNSMKKSIEIGKRCFDINLEFEIDIFKEFDKILENITK